MLSRVFFIFFIMVGSFVFSIAAHATEGTLVSGIYEDLLIARNTKTQEVTGYYNNQTGAGRFTCIFFLKGKIIADTAEIESYYPETPAELIKGKLIFTKPNVVTIALSEDHGGCWNVQHFADKDQPALFSLEQAHENWNAIKIIKVKKAFFFDSADSKTHRKSFVVSGDAVGVVDEKKGWFRVEYIKAKKMTSGWIAKEYFYE
ncbi:MAG: hypothetical protein WA160_14840 [Pseudobdellovibrio sp.]